MENRSIPLSFISIVIFAILILVGITWLNYEFVIENIILNDFLTRWAGTRLFMIEGLSPYSQQATEEINQLITTQTGVENESQGLFLYPFYSILIFAPYSLVEDSRIASAMWLTTLEVSILLMLVINLNLSQWKTTRWMFILLLVFSTIWYITVRPGLNGDIAVIIALLISLAFLAIRSNLDAFAGFLLALASIKPQMVILLFLFILIWAISNHRWTIITSFIGSLLFLIIATSLLVPDWLPENLKQIIYYTDTNLLITPGIILVNWLPGIGQQMGWVLTILVSVVLVLEWRFVRDQKFLCFFWTAMLTLVMTNLIGMYTSLDYFIAMYPALILILALWNERWKAAGRILTVISVLLLSFGFWGMILIKVEKNVRIDLDPLIFFSVPIFLLIGLYWVRWWAIRQHRLPLEEFADHLREV
jgi:uncharacterized membrane protein